jgi:uncharacterized membrane protein YjjP (DUF1212 family)
MNKIFTKSYLFVLGVSLLVYLLPEIFFHNAMLYIIGGSVGGTLKEILSAFASKPNDSLVFLIWFVLLVGITVLYYRLQNKPLKYLTVFVVFGLLYVVDFIIFEILSNDFQGYYLITGISVFLKGLVYP